MIAPDAAAAMSPLREVVGSAPTDSPRHYFAHGLFALSMFVLPATVASTPWGLAPGALLGLLAVVLAPDRVWNAAREYRQSAAPLWLLALATLLLVAWSQAWFDLRLSDTGNRTRLLMLPICFIGALAFRPPRVLLWTGALVGLAGAMIVAVIQCLGGEPRAHGWSNSIAFADVVLALVVLAVFLRPPGRAGWAAIAAGMGVVAIGLSGSRGVWLATILVLSTGSWLARRRMPRGGLLALLLATVVVSCALAPQAGSRISQVGQDLAQYQREDPNSSLGARLELLVLAAQTTWQHPLTGIGVGRFGTVVRAAPDCAGALAVRNERLCTLRHAHSDLPEWAATLGIPGLLCIIAIYALPLRRGLRALRGRGRMSHSAAMAVVMMATAFFVSGLSQSLFAHQLTASVYAILVGTLLAYVKLEEEADG